MIFAALIGLLLARKLSVRSRLNTATEAKAVGYDDVRGLVRGIVLHLALDRGGRRSLLLFLRFLFGYGYGVGEAAWHAVFHSVSAFNNAGFALYSDNLIAVRERSRSSASRIAAARHPRRARLPGHRAAAQGVPPPAALDDEHEARALGHGRAARRSARSTSPSIEWNNPGTLGPLDPARARARGLLPVGADPHGRASTRSTSPPCIDESWLGMDVLMFIGAGPAGTAGGIKVTTFAVLFFIIMTEFRGEGSREHLRQAALARGAPPGDHRRAHRGRRGDGRRRSCS